MARTKMNVPFKCDFDDAQKRINRILTGEGFHETTIKTGENVWKKGTGMLTAMQFIKVEFASNQAVIYAWVQTGIGNIGGSEMDLKGFVAALPKRMLMKVLEKIKNAF